MTPAQRLNGRHRQAMHKKFVVDLDGEIVVGQCIAVQLHLDENDRTVKPYLTITRGNTTECISLPIDSPQLVAMKAW